MLFSRWRVPQGPGTHVLMDGGILDVPFADTDAFLVEYLAAVRRGQRVYVVEQKTDVFRFFVDLDYKAERSIDEKMLEETVRAMCDVVPGRCVVARAPPREVEGRIKSGVHIHWPETLVTRQEALAYRTQILMALDGPEWAEFIDASVYGGSGLRMLWSHKKPTGDPYVPVDCNDPSLDMLRLFSIRTAEDKPTIVVTESTDALERYIQKYIPGQERARVKRVGQKGDTKWVQTDSRYCENIGQEHKSNHVWFSITGNRICQLCHDAETCHGFVGREYILSPSIVDVGVVDTPRCSILSLLPDHWVTEIAGDSLSEGDAQVLGARSNAMVSVQAKHSSVRRRNGRSKGGKVSLPRYGEYP